MVRHKTIALTFLALLLPLLPTPSMGAPLSPDSGNRRALEAAAEAGNASAENALGNLDYEGRQGKKDWVRARHEYQKAARNGSLAGARNFGWMLWKGEGGAPRDGVGRSGRRRAKTISAIFLWRTMTASRQSRQWMYF